MTKTIAIIGASLAGAHAAHQLRKDGFDGRIHLIGEEAELPYDRPPLSKAILNDETTAADIRLWPEAAYAEAEIDLILSTRVAELDLHGRAVRLANGSSLSVDKILLCTG